MGDMHKTIMKAFGTRDRWSNLPYGVRGKRTNFGKFLPENGLNKGVEIGVRGGDFSVFLCRNNPNIEISCIDPWVRYGGYSQQTQDGYLQRAEKQLAPHNATILRMKSLDALKHFKPRTLDFAFIDGDHRFDSCMMDIIEWSRKVRKGGIVACHDYTNLAEVGTAVRAYTAAHRIDPWYRTREFEATAFWVKP